MDGRASEDFHVLCITSLMSTFVLPASPELLLLLPRSPGSPGCASVAGPSAKSRYFRGRVEPALFLLLLTPWGLVWHRLLWQVTSLQPIMMGQSGINVPEGQTEAQ